MEIPSTSEYLNISQLKLRISNLENEIGRIFDQIQHFKQKIISKKFLLENMGKETQLSKVKLLSYQNEVQIILRKNNPHQVMQNMKDIIDQKRQALNDLQIKFEISAVITSYNVTRGLGITENEIQCEISSKTEHFHKERTDLLASIKDLEIQINSIKEKELQIEQTIKVIHKRNAAQLLRLKSLMNEVRLREQHWSAEVQKVLHKTPNTDC